MTRKKRLVDLLVISVLVALCAPHASAASIYLDGDTPATGSLLGSQPLVTPYGTITFVGEFRAGPSDPEFIAAGASGNIFDGAGRSPAVAQFLFDFDVLSITFIYGGNFGEFDAEARDINGLVLDSFYQASTADGEPAGPVTLFGPGIRSLYWQDLFGSFVPIDNVTVTVGVIPEPSTLLLTGLGLAALIVRRRFARTPDQR